MKANRPRAISFASGIPRQAALVRAVVVAVLFAAPATACQANDAPQKTPCAVLELPPGAGNPRNSEGDFVELADGSLLLIYTHFEGGTSDHAAAFLASRRSVDGGRTWTARDEVVVENEAENNVMSVSLKRLQDGRIALLYLRKNSLTDCRPVIRFSDDEGKSWSQPISVIGEEELGYYVVNNDRLVQLADGRLIVPTAQHNTPERNEFTPYATIYCYLSDDGGRTWRRAPGSRDGTGRDRGENRVMLQEPGVVELKDHRLLMWARTNAGSQFVSHSRDRGETWSPFRPSPLESPTSPASIERIPSTGDLLAVWNDHSDIAPALRGKRTPLTVAISSDEGETWKRVGNLYDDPDGWYCYTAMTFSRGRVLLGHCAGDRTRENGLARSRITRFPVEWLDRPEGQNQSGNR